MIASCDTGQSSSFRVGKECWEMFTSTVSTLMADKVNRHLHHRGTARSEAAAASQGDT